MIYYLMNTREGVKLSFDEELLEPPLNFSASLFWMRNGDPFSPSELGVDDDCFRLIDSRVLFLFPVHHTSPASSISLTSNNAFSYLSLMSNLTY